MKKDITYRQLINFADCAAKFIEKNKDVDTKPIHGMVASLKSVQKQIRKDEIFEDYNDRVLSNRRECCSEDKHKNIDRDDRGEMKFTKEADKKLADLGKKLLKETVEIHTRILPGNELVELTDYEMESFEGIVIPEIAVNPE